MEDTKMVDQKEKPKDGRPIDWQALCAETLRRFPKIIARLAR